MTSKMLPVVLVLFAATSAFAAPSIYADLVPLNEVTPLKNNGQLVSNYLIDRSFEIRDGGDTNVYVVSLQQNLKDLANSNRRNQAISVGQTIAVLGALATGVPGNSCAEARLIDAYVSAVRSNNYSGVRSALADYIAQLSSNIDLIVQLANNPGAARFASGPRGSCSGGGRTYAFEAAWDSILATSDSRDNEQYCTAKRLYNALSVQSNNVGAAVTASALSPVTQIFERSIESLAGFLRAVESGNAAAAAGQAKSALQRAAKNVSF